MSNSWFQFKQFTIHQDACAMKVSTDACIQGAWTPIKDTMHQVLDVGAGTGLLSLILAQRLAFVHIEGLESNPEAAIQAAENVKNSRFGERITIHQVDATNWKPTQLYDLIICNPPFFHKSLKGPDDARNSARHTGVLNPESLVKLFLENLCETGFVSIMWPPEEFEVFKKIAFKSNLFLQQKLSVQDKELGRVTRMIGLFGLQKPEEIVQNVLIIKATGALYSKAFTDLMEPYYLK